MIKLSILNAIIKAEAEAKNLILEAKNDQKTIIETSKIHGEEEAKKILEHANLEATKIINDNKEQLKANKEANELELAKITSIVNEDADRKIEKLTDFVVGKVLEL